MNRRAWQAVIDGLLEAVWLVSARDLQVVATNRAAETLLRVESGALVGRSVSDLTASPEDAFFWEEVAAGTADSILSDTLLNRADGSAVHVTRRISPLQIGDEPPMFVVAIQDRSEQHRVESELETLIAELRATLESTADGMLVTDLNGTIRGYNQRFAELWNLPAHLLTERDDAAVSAWLTQCVVDPESYSDRLGSIQRSPLLESTDVLVLRSGVVLERVTVPQCSRGRPIGRVYSYRDISLRLAAEARLQLAGKVFECSHDAIFITDAEHRIVAANPSFERLTGYARDEIIGCLPQEFIANRNAADFDAQVRTDLAGRGIWQGDVWTRRKGQGGVCPCLLSLVRVKGESGDTSNHIGFFKDLTEVLAAKKRIEELAYQDALTGLPNRMLLAERFDKALNVTRRADDGFAVLFLDLDRFKQVNDSLGHMFGDRVLIKVAERLKRCMRQVDTASRLGGDEFVLLLDRTSAEGAEITARRVLETLSLPFNVDDMAFTLTCSIGIALFPEDGTTMDDLIKNADSAMYSAKERGRSDFRFYKRQMNVGLLSRVKLDHAIRQALSRGDFSLKFQPQVELDSGRVFGAEALIRWHDPVLGHIPPGQFIPIAEESGAIVPIGAWVLQQAVGQAAAWHRKGLDFVTSINVSPLQFQQSGFIDSVEQALRDAALPPHLLELELTESILIHDVQETLSRLHRLASLGVVLVIDDFGTGYSSLGYLKRFPIRKLKIDRSFVENLPGDESDGAIVRAIVNLARALNLRVIAEGVETEAQRQFLLAAGCDDMQGFLCSPALDSGDLEHFASQAGCVPAPIVTRP